MDLAKHFLAYAGAATFHPTRKANVVVPAEPVTSKSFMTPSSQTEAEITGRTILVVDDEPSILKCVQRVLEHADYDVITSPSGSHALEIIEGRRPKIDLVLIDMVMPGSIDGLTLSL
ncbi:MAG TPA: response regulator [Chthoniobacterales bacterium]|nr:response regulator [Chthoniobacterales bacterium]